MSVTVVDEDGLRAALALHASRRDEAVRLHGLTDRWLAESLRRIASDCQTTSRDGPTLADVAFEIARRLGCASVARGPLAGLDPAGLRAAAADGLSRMGHTGPMAPGDPLAADPARGNPMLIGLDRVAPPVSMPPDAPSRRVSDACAWLGIPDALAWHPGMLPTATGAGVLAGILAVP